MDGHADAHMSFNVKLLKRRDNSDIKCSRFPPLPTREEDIGWMRAGHQSHHSLPNKQGKSTPLYTFEHPPNTVNTIKSHNLEYAERQNH